MATAATPYPTNIAYEPMSGADNSTTAFLYSLQNLMGGEGQRGYQQGQAGYQTALGALGPTMDYLTQLTKGDQGDISQATQPEANRIRDSFNAVRNMISQQPRGGGKAGALAEAPYQQQQQINDLAQQARTGAAGQLGQLATTLAGLGLDQSSQGLQLQNLATQAALTRRGQNIGQTSRSIAEIMGAASSAGTALFGA